MTASHGKDAILAHQYAAKARKYRLRWIIALSSLPLFGIVTAFGLTPETDTRQVPVQNIIENLSLPTDVQITTAQTDNATLWHDEQIVRGDTVSSILQRLGLSTPQILQFLKSPDATRALIQIRPGKRVQAAVSGSGKLVWLRHVGTDGNMLEITPDGQQFSAKVQPVALTTRTVMKSGVIHDSLFAATDAAGIPDTIATQIANIFSTDIDFHQDLRRNDRFNISVAQVSKIPSGEGRRIGIRADRHARHRRRQRHPTRIIIRHLPRNPRRPANRQRAQRVRVRSGERGGAGERHESSSSRIGLRCG